MRYIFTTLIFAAIIGIAQLTHQQTVVGDIHAWIPQPGQMVPPPQLTPQFLQQSQTIMQALREPDQEVPQIRRPYQRLPEIRWPQNQLQIFPPLQGSWQQNSIGSLFNLVPQDVALTWTTTPESLPAETPDPDHIMVGMGKQDRNTTHFNNTIASLQIVNSSNAKTSIDSNTFDDDNKQSAASREKFPIEAESVYEKFTAISGNKLHRSTFVGHANNKAIIRGYERSRAKDELPTAITPQCSNDAIRTAIIENISDDISTSKRQIHRSIAEQFGGRIDVICSKSAFSYVVNTDLFCESEKNNITCFVFRQST